MTRIAKLLVVLFPAALTSADINPDLLTRAWPAQWIVPSEGSLFDYGVYHFRQNFDLEKAPDSFVVHVTADNRYQLFVNGRRVVWGPARGDLFHWRFETIDIAPYLKKGTNVLAAVVWNFGEYAPEAQVTRHTGFLLQGNGETEKLANTGTSWKCLRNPAYQPLHYSHAQMRGYFVAGPGDRVDGNRYPWGWETEKLDDSKWPPARTDGRWRGSPRGIRDAGNHWMLVPREIPLMEEKSERLTSVRRATGLTVPPNFLQPGTPLRVAARTQARLLIDRGVLTTAYPELEVSGGRGARISLGYAEALYEAGARRGDKGNRNEVEGKEFVGYYDIFLTEGGNRRLYRPLWWRTYRYLDLKIETGDDPLTIEDLRGIYTGYPFEFKARFDGGSGLLTRILEVGWRTARLCAHESYMDCPYYEQLQYAGDTRIQCLISYYNAGDGRLARNAISHLGDSRTSEGLTMSRAPTRQPQYIPPFSLWWIGMLHDYWRYQDDSEFVRLRLSGTRPVLDFFAGLQKPNAPLSRVPFWNFVDWTNQWSGGVPPMGQDGSSALLDLQLMLAYGWAADMEDALGSAQLAQAYRTSGARLREAFLRLYWDANRGLFADTPAHDTFSQQANALAIIVGLAKENQARSIMEKILEDKSLVQCSYYFQHYLHTALNLAGMGDRYLDLLGPWQTMLERGLTTWAERPEGASNPARSDCHAWSSHPNFELFRTVLGIDSAAPGFSRVVIRPFPGKLERVSGSIPHPKGEVSVSLRRVQNKLEAEVQLPEGVSGEFVWAGTRRELRPGRSSLSF
jgi:hypothetical protein